MNRALADAELVRKYSAPMKGVFSVGDLRRLFGEDTQVLLYRRIRVLEEGSILTRFSRGYYITPGYSPETLSARIIEGSYLSLGTVLAKELMIGSIPALTVYAVRVGSNRRFEGPGLTAQYVGLSEELFFGYTVNEGVRCATPEKALLDTLYFHIHGRVSSFNIYQDIDVTRVDRDLIVGWLAKYRNPRFKSFVKGYLDDRR